MTRKTASRAKSAPTSTPSAASASASASPVGDDAPVRLQVDEKLYLKDPTSTRLGRDIVDHGIRLMDEIGYEEFTFRKLADRIGSTEASLYRYFRSKHLFLLYLTSYYWSWLEYRIGLATRNIASAEERLRLALRELTQTILDDADTPHVSESALYRIVSTESSKTYLQREVDAENREGFFRSYKRLCRGVADLIVEINPAYPYPVALVSTVVESSHRQKYFAEHLPSLTEVKIPSVERSTTAFLTELVFVAIGQKGAPRHAR
ncbi:MAG: TetR/AcrR family transcriptional regulator [Gemmatimonadaceae bacterium]|nr:TetR/AcrR family transcriptional regulator [Gemmatimonadaceae bacterium]